jgi:hypothetical protein
MATSSKIFMKGASAVNKLQLKDELLGWKLRSFFWV